jgi:hypothetical protein
MQIILSIFEYICIVIAFFFLSVPAFGPCITGTDKRNKE